MEIKGIEVKGEQAKELLKVLKGLGIDPERHEEDDRELEISLKKVGSKLECKVAGTEEGLINLFINAIHRDPDIYDILLQTMHEVNHKLSCNCENCTEFRTDFFEQRKEQKHD